MTDNKQADTDIEKTLDEAERIYNVLGEVMMRELGATSDGIATVSAVTNLLAGAIHAHAHHDRVKAEQTANECRMTISKIFDQLEWG